MYKIHANTSSNTTEARGIVQWFRHQYTYSTERQIEIFEV